MGRITTPVLYDGTYSSVFAEALARIRANAPTFTGLVPADPGIAILDAMIFELHKLGMAANDVPIAALIAWLNVVGVEVKAAVAAQAVITVTIEEPLATDYTISSGAKFLTANGVSFSSQAEAVIPAGATSVGIEVVCDIRGTTGNVRAHEINGIYQNLPYVKTVDNAEPASGGYASELDAAALERGRRKLSYLETAVTLPDHENMACEVSGVARAKAIDVGNAIALYLVDNEGLAPSSVLIAEVIARFANHRGVLPLNVYAAEFVNISVTANIIFMPGVSQAAVKQAIVAKLTTYLSPLAWPWGSANAETRAAYLSEIAQTIEETPGVDAMDELVFPTANLKLDRHQLPRLGEVTLNAI